MVKFYYFEVSHTYHTDKKTFFIETWSRITRWMSIDWNRETLFFQFYEFGFSWCWSSSSSTPFFSAKLFWANIFHVADNNYALFQPDKYDKDIRSKIHRFSYSYQPKSLWSHSYYRCSVGDSLHRYNTCNCTHNRNLLPSSSQCLPFPC